MRSLITHPGSEVVREFLGQCLGDPFFAEALFDQLPDVVFFVKDRDGRYVVVNDTLIERCGFSHKHELIGHLPQEVFPAPFGAGYEAQDRFVIEKGQALKDRLELHLHPNHAPGWCLTHKIPLHDEKGAVVGLAGISRDLRIPNQQDPVYRRVAAAVSYLQAHYGEPLTVTGLTERARLSSAQFERYIRRIFDLTPKQLLIKTRLDAAAQQLAGDRTIAEIAHACGYADHSAFSRQFKAVVGLTPSEYRALRDV